jgi:hypothetical protein
MGKPKDAIWEKFGACYRQGDARSMYCKCSSCNEPVHQLCPDNGYESEHEMDPVDEDEDAVGGNVDEFDRVNISKDVDGMHDEDIFEAKEVMDEGNIYE